jgi:TonB family protein
LLAPFKARNPDGQRRAVALLAARGGRTTLMPRFVDASPRRVLDFGATRARDSENVSMAKRERFGKLILTEETEGTGLGAEYRAAKLGPAGLDKLVTILRLKPAISGNLELARSLMDQAKLAAQLQHPNILKIFGIGKVDQTYYISYEFIEAKSLRAILERCRQETFPFSVEHALLIASKVCSALEGAQARRLESGARYFHGLLTPGSILVSYEGEVRVKGFGYWPSQIRSALPEADLSYLAPEQAAGGEGDGRSDIHALGAVLFETLTGQPPAGGDLASRVAGAKLQSPSGEDDSLAPPLAEILKRSLAAEPAARYADVQEMRKAIDTLLFSGDFTPTTFNLAFFMHSLYRDDIEQESKAVKEDREASYLEYLAEEPKPATGPRPPAPEPPPSRTETSEAKVEAPRAETASRHEPLTAPLTAPPPSETSPGHSPKEAAAGFTFHKEEKRSQTPLLLGAAAILLLAGGAAYYFLTRSPAPPVQAPATLSPEAVAAQKRVKELEEKLAAIEAEKAAAEAKAAEEAKKRVEAQAKARGQVVDPAALQQAQDEARKKAKAEQEAKQQEELRNLAEQKKAEQARLAEEKRKADEQARAEQARAEQARLEQSRAAEPATLAAAPAATPTPAPPEAASPSVAAGLRPGTLVTLSDPGVIAPVVERTPPLQYPPIALRQRVEGTVELNVLVDDKGSVTDAQVVQAAGGRAGLNEAAVENVKRRHYRPATKDGVPVKVWMSVRVKFELPH